MTPSRIKFQNSRLPQLSLAFGIQFGYGKVDANQTKGPARGRERIMSLLELADRLIREHGSASISKEHVELLREEARASEMRHAQELADANAARAKEVQELQSAHAKEIAQLQERHAEERAQRERTLLWLLFCASIWGLGLGLCELIIEKLYFR
jgi:hypothetical protein